jgi:hypothetical protein
LANEFVAKSARNAQEQEEWHQTAQSLQKEYRELTQRKAAMEKETKEFDALVASRAHQQTVAFTAEQLQGASEKWDELSQFLESHDTMVGMKMLDNILEKKSNALTLDAKKPELRLDLNTIERVSKLLSMQGGSSLQPYIDGKLDLANLTQIWSDSLTSVIRPKLGELTNMVASHDDESQTGDYIADSVRRLKQIDEQHNHHATAARKTTALIKQQLIPEMEENIARLQSTVDERVRHAVSKMVVPPTPSTASVAMTPRAGWPRMDVEQTYKPLGLDLVPPTPAIQAQRPRVQPPTTVSKRQPSEVLSTDPFTLLPGSFAPFTSKEVAIVAPDQDVVAKMSGEIRAAVSSLSRSNLIRASPASAASRKQKRINAAAALTQAATPSSKLPTKDNLAAFGLSPLQVDTFDVDELMKDLPPLASAAAPKSQPAVAEKKRKDADLKSYIPVLQTKPQDQIATKPSGRQASIAREAKPQKSAPTREVRPPVQNATSAVPASVVPAAKESKPSKRDNLPAKPWVIARQMKAAEAAAAAQAEKEAAEAAKASKKAQARPSAAQTKQNAVPSRPQSNPDVEKAFRIMTQQEPAPELEPTNYTMVDESDANEAFKTRKQIVRTPEVKSSRSSYAGDDADIHELEQTVNFTIVPNEGFDGDMDYDRMLDELDRDSVRDGSSKRLTIAQTHQSPTQRSNVDNETDMSLREDEEDLLEKSVEDRFSKAVNAFSRAPAAKDARNSPKRASALDPELSIYEAELDRLDSPAKFKAVSRHVEEDSREDEENLSFDQVNESTQSSIEMATASDVPMDDNQLASPSSPSAGRWTSLRRDARISESPVSFGSQHRVGASEQVKEQQQSVSLLDDSFVVPVEDNAAEDEDPIRADDILNGSLSLDTHLSGARFDDEMLADSLLDGEDLTEKFPDPAAQNAYLDTSISLEDVAENADSGMLNDDNLLGSPLGLVQTVQDINDSLAMPSPTLHRITKQLSFSPKPESTLSFGSPL